MTNHDRLCAEYPWYAPHQKWLAEEGGERADLRGTDLSGADLSGADLSGADLRGTDLSGTDLRGTVLRGAVLRGADLRGAVIGMEVPRVADLDRRILEALDHGGMLRMADWHTCETTHCLAGWAVTLAGEAGAALEAKVGSSVAGALIYAASQPDQPVPDLYAHDDEALADLRRRVAAGATP